MLFLLFAAALSLLGFLGVYALVYFSLGQAAQVAEFVADGRTHVTLNALSPAAIGWCVLADVALVSNSTGHESRPSPWIGTPARMTRATPRRTYRPTVTFLDARGEVQREPIAEWSLEGRASALVLWLQSRLANSTPGREP